jgi:hypothetical protein
MEQAVLINVANFNKLITVLVNHTKALELFIKQQNLRQPNTTLQEPVLQEPVLQEPVLQEPVLQEPVLQEPTQRPPFVINNEDMYDTFKALLLEGMTMTKACEVIANKANLSKSTVYKRMKQWANR